ncbi:MAG: hypothetical protein IT367_16915 [Candidatus Hydrogenedentes bacterium]|nr:hypothetical protein [Candidatus Hydrogenedentota bacterium]
MKVRTWPLIVTIFTFAVVVIFLAFSFSSRNPVKQDATLRVPTAKPATKADTRNEPTETTSNETRATQSKTNPAPTRPIEARELWRVELELTKARLAREKEATVAAESIEETIRYAMFQESFSETLGLKDQLAWYCRPSHAKELVFQDIRMQKLLASATHPEDIQRIKDEIRRGFEKYLHGLPLIDEGDEPSLIGETVSGSPGVGVAAILFAELDDRGDSLPLLVELHEHTLKASRARVDQEGIEDTGEYIGSANGAMFAEAEIILLDRMLEDMQANTPAGGEVATLLAEYDALRYSDVFQESRTSNGAFCMKQEHMFFLARRIAATMSR